MEKVSLWEIFKIFFVIGIQLLGGGYVIVPLLKKYIVEQRNWLKEDELTDFFALSQCIPGIIAGNISVLAGWKIRGIPGAIAAISGIILPAFVSILVIANFITEIIYSTTVQNAFWGIRISVIVLIIITVKELWQKSVNSIFSYVLFFAALSLLIFTDISVAAIITITAIIYPIILGIKRRNNA